MKLLAPLALCLGAMLVLPWSVPATSAQAISQQQLLLLCVGTLEVSAIIICCCRCRDMGIIPGPIPRNTTRTAADEPQETAAYSRRVLTFPCSGVKCQAWLYMPKHSEEKPPVIVAAHGVGECHGSCALGGALVGRIGWLPSGVRTLNRRLGTQKSKFVHK
jgi:hypothetical protein